MQKTTKKAKKAVLKELKTPPATLPATAPSGLPSANVSNRVKALCTSLVVQGERQFLDKMSELEAKDYCDIYVRLLTLAQKEASGEPSSTPLKGVTNLINTLSVNLLKQ